MIYLKQSTASQEVLLGPFVDSTDGVTAETALTIANTDIKLHVAGATTLANKNSGGATHISNGNYYAVLDATDTATLGSGCIIVQVAGALAVRVDFCVLAANVYDSLIGGGDVLDVSTTQFNGTAVTASAGRPEVNMTHIAGSAASTSTAQLGVNVVNFGGAAGTFTSGRPEVNTTHLAGTSQTARDIGASVLLSSGTGTGQISLSAGAVKIQTGIKKNQAIANFPFVMKDDTGAPLTGSTVTVTRSLDGAAFGATTAGTATEISSGWYQIDLSASDTNGDTVALRFTGSGGSGTPADGGVTIITEP